MRRLGLITLATVLLAGALPATASTFVAMSQKELLARADAIVEGRIVDLESFWTESGRLIATDATLAVDEVLSGRAPRALTVRTFGGQVGAMRVEAHGFPRFEDGERVLLFLTRDRDGTYRVLGYQLGHYRVVTRLDGVTLAVPQTDDGMRLVGPNGTLAPAPGSVRLDEFKTRIRGARR